MLIMAVPSTRPILVRPAKAERKVRLSRCHDFIDRSFQNSPPIKPIMVIAEAMDSIGFSQRSLGFPCFREPEVIKTKIRRAMRLVMAREEWAGFHDIAPLRKTLAPP